MGGIDNVMADVVLKQLAGEATYSPPNGSDQHQYIGTADLGLQGALDRFQLPLDAPNPAYELRLVFYCV